MSDRVILDKLNLEETLIVWGILYRRLYDSESDKLDDNTPMPHNLAVALEEHIAVCDECRALIDLVKDLQPGELEKIYQVNEIELNEEATSRLFTIIFNNPPEILKSKEIVLDYIMLKEKAEKDTPVGKIRGYIKDFGLFVYSLKLFAKHIGYIDSPIPPFQP